MVQQFKNPDFYIEYCRLNLTCKQDGPCGECVCLIKIPITIEILGESDNDPISHV